MIYRILKNNKNFIIQVRKYFFWFYIKGTWADGQKKGLTLFRNFINISGEYATLDCAKKAIANMIEYDEELRRSKSKYRVVETIRQHDSPLFKALNEDKDK
jgi:hypothetical protein